VWELSLFGAGACERFFVETSTGEISAKCRWLVATDHRGNGFAAEQEAIPLFGC
jgi:hypothetical protein